MDEEKIIAKYIRTRMPELLNTTDYALFAFSERVSKMTKDMVDNLRNIFNAPSFEQIIRMIENGAKSNEVKDNDLY